MNCKYCDGADIGDEDIKAHVVAKHPNSNLARWWSLLDSQQTEILKLAGLIDDKGNWI